MRGWSLVEVMLAALFMGIALFAYFGLESHLLASKATLTERQAVGDAASQDMAAGLSTAAAHPDLLPEVPGGPPGLRQVRVEERGGVRYETWMREVNSGW